MSRITSRKCSITSAWPSLAARASSARACHAALPPALASRFTTAETAVLSVIACEVAKHGACTLTIGHIAALAGVCGQTVRNALKAAQAVGLVHVEQRRVTAFRNKPNRVTI